MNRWRAVGRVSRLCSFFLMDVKGWLVDFFRELFAPPKSDSRRERYYRPSYEVLESREMLAADLFIGDLNVGESGTAYFPVSLMGMPSGPVSVNYSTASGTAVAGSDYTAVSGTLEFQPWEMMKTIEVPILGDTHHEGSENFSVNLSGASLGDIRRAARGIDPRHVHRRGLLCYQ